MAIVRYPFERYDFEDTCDNMECSRNKKHVPKDTGGLLVAMADFKTGCKIYKHPLGRRIHATKEKKSD